MINFSEKIVRGERQEIISNIKQDILNNKKRVIITANSESFVHSSENIQLQALMLDDDSKIIIDGIAALLAFKYLKLQNVIKIPGVEIVHDLLDFVNTNKMKLAVLGGTEESIQNFQSYLSEHRSNIDVVGISNGYIDDREGVLNSFAQEEPDLILVALGVPNQELLIQKCLHNFNKGLFIGCGGSIDVIGKTIKRAPQIFRVTSTEWLYRIIKEPKRMKRFFSTNFRFFRQVLSVRKNAKS